MNIFVLVWLFLTYVGTLQARTESEARTECVAGCLKTFRTEVSSRLLSLLKLNPELINQECGQRPSSEDGVNDQRARGRCHMCTHVCNYYATNTYREQLDCRKFCKTVAPAPVYLQQSCNSTCFSIKNLLVSNQGVCPKVSSNSQQDPLTCRAHGMTCNPANGDKTCYGQLSMKCCNSECGFVCLSAEHNEHALPPVPRSPKCRQDSSKDSIQVDWSTYNVSAYSHPIVFLIQLRSHKSYRFNAAVMAASSWTDLAFTTKTVLDISALEIGSWYQFRLAAISSDGLKGYSLSSDPVKLSKEPRRPSPVRNLQEGISRLHDKLVDVQILWKKPSRSDLDIAKYEVKWVETLGEGRQKSLTKFETQVPGSSTEYYLPNLKPGSTYDIMVWAIAYYGYNTQLRSKKSSIFIKTMTVPLTKPIDKHKNPQIPSASAVVPQVLPPSSNTLPDCSCDGKPKSNVITHTPYFQTGDIKMLALWTAPEGSQRDKFAYVATYLLKWTQRVCIESTTLKPGTPSTREAVVHGKHVYLLTRLTFNCHYALQIQGLTESGHTAYTLNTCFCTTSCKQTPIKGSIVPDCPLEQPAHVPQPPTNVKYKILPNHQSSVSMNNKGITYVAKISWGASELLNAIKGFRITWGPRLFENVNPVLYSRGLDPKIDKERSDTKIVDARERQFYLPNLKSSTIYIVHIQTLTVFGDSLTRIVHFATPGRRNDYNSIVQKYIHPGTKSTVSLCSTSMITYQTVLLTVVYYCSVT